MGGTLNDIELQIMQVRHQLSTFYGFVAPSDIKDGYTVESLKEKLRKLERSKKLILSYSEVK